MKKWQTVLPQEAKWELKGGDIATARTEPLLLSRTWVVEETPLQSHIS